MQTIKSILHPYDYSAHSDYALQLAVSLAGNYGARLTVLHVLVPPVAMTDRVMAVNPPDSHKQLAEKIHSLELHDPKFRLEYRIVEGEPAAEILRVANEMDCDLIVMGTHGRTGVDRLLMGSIADKVLRGSSCPVLTVKNPLALARTSDPTLPPKSAVERSPSYTL